MSKNLIKLMMLSIFFSIAFVSCSDDPTYKKETIENAELLAVLQKAGLTFEGNLLVVDNKVNELKELDLSGTKIADFTGLELFENLTSLNLSNNDYETTFDFTKLPANIKSIDLSDNKIYEYKGLAEVSDAGFKNLKELKKLILPASARFNIAILPHYYKENKEQVEIKMQNTETKKLEDYTTLRTIPDGVMLGFIKTVFPSVMEGDKVDISKAVSEAVPVLIETTDFNQYNMPVDMRECKNFEGIEYIINSPSYTGGIINLNADPEQNIKISYLSLKPNTKMLGLLGVEADYINWESMTGISSLVLCNNKSIKAVDLSRSKKLMTKKESYLPDFMPPQLIFFNLPNLEEIKLPSEGKGVMHKIMLLKLPKLKEFDFSNFEGVAQIGLANVNNVKIKMPTIKYWIGKIVVANDDDDDDDDDEAEKEMSFSITENMMENTEVAKFIKTYKGHLIPNDHHKPSWDALEYDSSDLNSYDYTK